MTSNEIRQQFLDFFKSKDHETVESSPVVPVDDPTLMFANAGMNQFKDVFLGTGSRPYTRAADTQKCIRAGGKHNDLDDVGQDTYHHTFFEMLGNWSFGDYFKKEAIEWAWELLTEVWKIDSTRLHATYFEGDESEGLEPDIEAAELWKTATNIIPEHIHPGNKKDNFWEMGDTGPCGPCSEIHIDLTPDKSGGNLINADDPRVIELWNLVFIQFNRGSDRKLSPLPAKHVDTGMGFERLCAVLNGKSSNYDTDVWSPIFDAISKRTGAPAYTSIPPGMEDKAPRSELMNAVSYRVIADHLRCLTFALTDGAVPDNEGRGYVLRRILRRAVRYGRQYFNMREPYLHDLVQPLVDHMGDAFPELRSAHGGKNVEHVADIIRDEEESFGRTLERGIKLFNEAADYAAKHHHGRISGEDAFKLHDTYGFPIDLTELMAEENNLKIDIGEYERLMEEARKRARLGGAGQDTLELSINDRLPSCDDSAKYCQQSHTTTLLGWVTNGTWFDKATIEANPDNLVGLVTKSTCAYAESGGQIGDAGEIVTATGKLQFVKTQLGGDSIVHVGHVVEGYLETGQEATINLHRGRSATMKNHSATHMLNWALRKVLGEHVQQKGSLVDAEKTRFDFANPKALTVEEADQVEKLVNQHIDADLPISTKIVEQGKALEINTLRAVFGEKYPDMVRVVSMGADIDEMLADPKNDKWLQYPVEFCGGTHLSRTKEAVRFVLTSEEAVAKGIRRVTAITGPDAQKAQKTAADLLVEAKKLESVEENLAAKVTEFQRLVSEAEVPLVVRHKLREHISNLQKTVKKQQKEAESCSGDAVMDAVSSMLDSAEQIAGVHVVVGEVPSAKADAFRGAIDWIRNKTDASAVMLTCKSGPKVTIIAGMSKDVVGKGLKAGDLIKEIAPLVGGRGGGRPDMAQGGGENPDGIQAAIDRAKAWIAEKL